MKSMITLICIGVTLINSCGVKHQENESRKELKEKNYSFDLENIYSAYNVEIDEGITELNKTIADTTLTARNSEKLYLSTIRLRQLQNAISYLSLHDTIYFLEEISSWRSYYTSHVWFNDSQTLISFSDHSLTNAKQKSEYEIRDIDNAYFHSALKCDGKYFSKYKITDEISTTKGIPVYLFSKLFLINNEVNFELLKVVYD